MTQSRNALGNLIARYRSVLKHCRLLNTFGSLAVAAALAGALVMGNPGIAAAENVSHIGDDNLTVADGSTVTITGDGSTASTGALNITDGTVVIVETAGLDMYTNAATKTTTTTVGAKGRLTNEGKARLYTLENTGIVTTTNLNVGLKSDLDTATIASMDAGDMSAFQVSTTRLVAGGNIANAQVGDLVASGIVTAEKLLVGGTLTGPDASAGTGSGELLAENAITTSLYVGTASSTAALQANQVSIADGSTLTVTGNHEMASTNLKDTPAADGDLAIASGGTFDVDGTLTITAADTNAQTLDIGGNLVAATLNLKGSDNNPAGLNVDGGTVTVGGTNATSITLGGGNLNLAAPEGASHSYTNNVTVTTGALTTTGNWTIGKDGSSGVSGGTTLDVATGGTLTVQQGTLTVDGLLKSVDAGDIKVNSNGILSADYDTLFTDDTALATGLAKIELSGGGVVEVTGYTDSTSLSLADTKGYSDLLFEGDEGIIDFKDIDIDIATSDYNAGGELDGTLKSSSMEGTSVLVEDKSVGYTAATNGSVDVADTGGFAVGSVTVDTTSVTGDTVTATVDNSITLTGQNGKIIETTTAKTTDLTVAANKSLTIGSSAVQQTGSLTLDGDVTLGNGSQLNVLHSAVSMGTLNMGTSGNGGNLFLDPAYLSLDGTSTVFGTVAVGEGSVLVVGEIDDAATLQDVVQKAGIGTTALGAGFTVDTASSVLIVGAQDDGVGGYDGITIDSTGKLILDDQVTGTGTITGGPTVNANSAYFGADSLFVVDATNFDNTNNVLELDTNATLTVDSDAKLSVINAKNGVVYNLVGGTGLDISAANGWATNAGTIASDDRMLLAADIATTATGVTYTAGGVQTTNFGVDSEMFSGMQDLWAAQQNNTNDPNRGIAFLSRAAHTNFVSTNSRAATLIDSAAYMALAGGVAGMTHDTANLSAQAVENRLDGVKVNDGKSMDMTTRTGLGIWFTPLYQTSSVDDMDAGSISGGYDSDVYGGILGLDYKMGAGTMGLAFNVGGGSADSTGDYVSTDNDMTFWGVSLYGGYNFGALGLKADLGYTATENDLDQDGSELNMGQLSADVDASLFTMGLTADYLIDTVVDITPYLGVRYNMFRQDSFSNSVSGGNVFHVDDAEMDTFLIPVGVTFSGDILAGNWVITPRADISYIGAFGDTEVDNDVSVRGSAFGTASMDADVLDESTGAATLGLAAAYGNFSMGLDVGAQLSENRDAQSVSATFAYEF